MTQATPNRPRSIEELRAARANGETGAAFRDEVVAARDAEMTDCHVPQRPAPTQPHTHH